MSKGYISITMKSDTSIYQSDLSHYMPRIACILYTVYCLSHQE